MGADVPAAGLDPRASHLPGSGALLRGPLGSLLPLQPAMVSARLGEMWPPLRPCVLHRPGGRKGPCLARVQPLAERRGRRPSLNPVPRMEQICVYRRLLPLCRPVPALPSPPPWPSVAQHGNPEGHPCAQGRLSHALCHQGRSPWPVGSAALSPSAGPIPPRPRALTPGSSGLGMALSLCVAGLSLGPNTQGSPAAPLAVTPLPVRGSSWKGDSSSRSEPEK